MWDGEVADMTTGVEERQTVKAKEERYFELAALTAHCKVVKHLLSSGFWQGHQDTVFFLLVTDSDCF